MRLIALTGGIGSGKSVVARMLRTLGYEVYDCDSRAKAIMDADPSIRARIAAEVCSEAVVGDSIDRPRLAKVVFSDADALCRLNSIVHGAVRADISSWASSRDVAFVETAILYQSGIDRMVSEVWEVVAPMELRLLRAMQRDNAPAESVRARIEAQDAFTPESLHPVRREIVNDGVVPLLPQLLTLLSAQG